MDAKERQVPVQNGCWIVQVFFMIVYGLGTERLWPIIFLYSRSAHCSHTVLKPD